MSEMIERVARVLCPEPDAMIHPLIPGCLERFEIKRDMAQSVPMWTQHVEQARAAIAAMREPTPAILEALVCAACGDRDCKHDGWQAAIDAALKGEP